MYSVRHIAYILGVDNVTVLRWIKRGYLSAEISEKGQNPTGQRMYLISDKSLKSFLSWNSKYTERAIRMYPTLVKIQDTLIRHKMLKLKLEELENSMNKTSALIREVIELI